MATVKITYPRERWERAPEATREVIRAGLTEITSGVSAWIYDRAADSRDTATAQNSIGSDVQELGAGSFRGSSFASAPHAEIALETGRRPGFHTPIQVLIDWLQRKGFSAAQISKVRGVGARIGGAFRQGRQLSLAKKHIVVTTRQFGAADAALKSQAFAIEKNIFKYGSPRPGGGTVRKPPKLFTRAVRETRQSIQIPALKRMAEAIARIL